jgi:hypothetical protein
MQLIGGLALDITEGVGPDRERDDRWSSRTKR